MPNNPYDDHRILYATVNRAYAEYAANEDITESIPYDNTKPQINEGREILSVTIKPFYAEARIMLHFKGHVATDQASESCLYALFRVGQADALHAGQTLMPVANNMMPCGLDFEDIAGTTNPITYKIRVGTATGVFKLRFNGISTSRIFGGAARATLVAREIPNIRMTVLNLEPR